MFVTMTNIFFGSDLIITAIAHAFSDMWAFFMVGSGLVLHGRLNERMGYCRFDAVKLLALVMGRMSKPTKKKQKYSCV